MDLDLRRDHVAVEALICSRATTWEAYLLPYQ